MPLVRQVVNEGYGCLPDTSPRGHIFFDVDLFFLQSGPLDLRPSFSSFLPNSPQRLTLGLMVAELNNGELTRKLEVMRIGGTGCVVIKYGRNQPSDPMPADVLDVDVSLRHAEITLGKDECAGLCALSSAYLTLAEQPAVGVVKDAAAAVATKPVKPLFREDFWYFEGDGNSTSGDLNFDTLSGLLEQVNYSLVGQFRSFMKVVYES